MPTQAINTKSHVFSEILRRKQKGAMSQPNFPGGKLGPTVAQRVRFLPREGRDANVAPRAMHTVLLQNVLQPASFLPNAAPPRLIEEQGYATMRDQGVP